MSCIKTGRELYNNNEWINLKDQIQFIGAIKYLNNLN